MGSRWRVLAAALAVVALGMAPASVPSRAATGRPNVVLILTDDLTQNLLQYMPNMQQLMARGTKFSNYIVTNSLCCPSRASILTGRLPHNTGIFSNTEPDGGFPAFRSRGEEADTVATDLQSRGYRTGLMGKYLNGYQPRASIPPGWSDWAVSGDNAYGEFNYKLNENGTVVSYGSSPEDYLTDVLARKAISFIGSAADAGTPFFLDVATYAPHPPYIPAPRDKHRHKGLNAPRTAAFNIAPSASEPEWLANVPPLTDQQIAETDHAFRQRARSVHSIDDLVGQVVAAVEAKGIADTTYIVFSSDNGFHMGEHRLLPGKRTAFDTDIRVPLIVVGPAVRAGVKVPALVDNTDLRSTIGELAGVPVPSTVDGHSFVSLLRSSAVDGWRTAVLVEHHEVAQQPGDPDAAPRSVDDPPTYAAVRGKDWVYIEYADGEYEFYDIAADPDQVSNLAARLTTSQHAALHDAVAALQTCHDTVGCWAAEHPNLRTHPSR